MGVGDVVQAGHAVVPSVDPKHLVVGADGNVHRQRNLAGVADVGHRLGLPLAVFILIDEPDFRGQRRGGEAVVVAGAPSAANLQGRAGHVEHLLRLAGVQVPDDHRVAEALHGLGVAHHLAEVHHVVVPAGERGGDHEVAPGQHPDVIAVAVGKAAALDRAAQIALDGHPVGGHVVAAVGVLHHAGAAAVVAIVGQPGDQHAPRQRVAGVRAHHAAGFGHEVIDGLVQARLGRVAVDIEDEYAAGVQAARPQKAAVVGETGVVGLVAPAHRMRVHHSAVGAGTRIDIHRHQLVLLIADARHAQGPNVNEVLLADDLGHVGRHAGLIRRRRSPKQRQATDQTEPFPAHRKPRMLKKAVSYHQGAAFHIDGRTRNPRRSGG